MSPKPSFQAQILRFQPSAKANAILGPDQMKLEVKEMLTYVIMHAEARVEKSAYNYHSPMSCSSLLLAVQLPLLQDQLPQVA